MCEILLSQSVVTWLRVRLWCFLFVYFLSVIYWSCCVLLILLLMLIMQLIVMLSLVSLCQSDISKASKRILNHIPHEANTRSSGVQKDITNQAHHAKQEITVAPNWYVEKTKQLVTSNEFKTHRQYLTTTISWLFVANGRRIKWLWNRMWSYKSFRT